MKTNAFRLGAVSLTGLLHPLCFPNFDLGWIAFVTLIPLHLAIDGIPAKKAFFMGWLAGVIAFASTVSWVITAMHLYGQVPLLISTLLMLLLATYLGIYFGLYALGASWLQKFPMAMTLVALPTLWVSLELLRTHFLSGLPWALLGYSQYQWLTVIQFADITGVYGVSFFIVLTNVALTFLIRWMRPPKKSSQVFPFPWGAATVTVTAFAVVLAYGSWRLTPHTHSDGKAHHLRIGLVQANIDQAHKWDNAYRQETLTRYASLSLQAAQDVDLLIWPEAATPFLFEREPVYQQQIFDIVDQTKAPLLLGSPTLRYQRDGQPYLFNSAFLLTESGDIAGRYDKRHLVPFGEYIPLSSSLLFFLDKFVVGIGDFIPGTGPLTLTLPQPPNQGKVRFGVAICFEVIFPDLVRRIAKEGADFLVTITNDAWFGDSVAPYQHFGMVVLRAVENRVAFARAANTGISGFIAPDGRIVKTTPIFTQEAVTGMIPLRTTTTFYSEHGDVFAWGCVIIATTLLWMARPTKRRQA